MEPIRPAHGGFALAWRRFKLDDLDKRSLLVDDIAPPDDSQAVVQDVQGTPGLDAAVGVINSFVRSDSNLYVAILDNFTSRFKPSSAFAEGSVGNQTDGQKITALQF